LPFISLFITSIRKRFSSQEALSHHIIYRFNQICEAALELSFDHFNHTSRLSAGLEQKRLFSFGIP
jgi:hypothetical protein